MPRVLAFLILACCMILAAASASATNDFSSTADHAKFKELQKVFASGPEVTKACLSCHTEASKQLHKTTHWTWEFENPRTGQKLGKRHIMNSFCGSPLSNGPWCTTCHIGYGWEDLRKDPVGEENVDCLVCHDTTRRYRKQEGAAGHPTRDTVAQLTEIAQKVGKTNRHNCGSCHFHGGGVNGAKHGDLDNSLISPTFYLDVHMDEMGLNFPCARCHMGRSHQVQGSRYATMARDRHGIDVPGRDDGSRASCESCHGWMPHGKTKLNDHVDRIACQTCHIPAYARGNIATKMWWDWSDAGRTDESGEALSIEDPRGYEVYSSKKGSFEFVRNGRPEYRWFNGKVRYTLLADKLDDAKQPIPMNAVEGSADDPDSRIWPFKVMRGRQPYDTVFKTLLVNHIAGSEEDKTAFWRGLDFDKSLKAGTDFAGQPYSGEYGFVETTMMWPITHMVAPAEDALTCDACHSRQGRMADVGGFHMPGRDFSPVLEFIGFLLVAVVMTGVIGHAVARFVILKGKGGGDVP